MKRHELREIIKGGDVPMLSGTKLAEVFSSTRTNVHKELHLDAAHGLTAKCDVEEYNGIRI